MSLVSEFKEFALRGNVVDLAVGIVIGAAFGKIVSSLVDGVIMPLVGLLIGGINFSDLAITLVEAQGETAAVQLKYGAFIQTVVDFTLIAFAIFIVIKLMNRLKRKQEAAAPAAPPEPSAEVTLLTEIRDALRARG